MAKDPEVLALARSLVGDIVGGFGLPRTEFFRALFWTLFRVPMVRFAAIGLTFDRLVAEGGFPKASQWALTNWCRRVTARGAENVPAEGPLLIVANHPGTYDALIVFSRVGRRDIRWISTEIPFLDKMPHVHDHVIFTSKRNALRRMSTMRAAIRHLQSGGALLYIGAGFIEPDPAVYPGAAAHIEGWLTGIDFFFHHVPGLRIMPAIVSGVISPRWARSPLAWLRRKDVDKWRLVGFGQVLTQLFFPGRLMFTPSVSFGPPVTVETLRRESVQENILPAVVARAKALLAEHVREFGGHPG